MKKIIVYLVFCFIISNISGQNIELSGGMNRNQYFDRQKDEGHFMAEYAPGNGYSIGLSFSDLKIDSLAIRISLIIENNKGKFYLQSGGQGGTIRTEAEVEKTTVGIGLYPLNFDIFKKIKFSFGGEFSIKINDNTRGYKSTWMSNGSSTYKTIENDSVQINNNFIWGISGQVSYDFRINQDWTIAPHYKLYLGMSDEFKNTETKIRSIRQNYEIGIIKRIK